MKIEERVVTRASAERAFALLADPCGHSAWNPRIVETAPGSGAPGIGYRYRVTYEMSGRRTEFDAEIVTFDAPRRWAARLEERVKGDGRHAARFMVESYTLSPRGGDRLHVCHEIRVHHSGVPLLLRALIWLVMRFGRPTGKTFMETFRDLAEAPEGPQRAA